MKALKIGHIWRWVPVLLTLSIITLVIPSGGHAGWLDPISDGTYTTYYWNSVSNPKFRYSFATTHQWQHYSKTNSSWYALSAAGLTATFIGNGAWHNLGTGLKYRYDSSNDFGFYVWGSSYRFYYRYLVSQWYTSGSGGGWYLLGTSGTNAGMLGAGFTNLGNGLSYHYNGSYDFGYYSRGSAYRFYYRHGVGQWYTSGSGGGWYELGTSGRNAGLAGASWTDLGTGLSFHYAGAYDFGYYLHGSAYRFYYRYGTGQWYNMGAYGGWQILGNAGLSASCLGDGNWHKMDSIWSYRYVSGVGYLEDLSGLTKTWWPDQYGTWGWNSVYTTCNYTTETLGLYESGTTSSVVQYTYNGASPYKWVDFNYDINSKTETSQAIIYYTGTSAHNVSSWLTWLPVNPTPGFITRTETWDFKNDDWANRYNHEVRAWAYSNWLVQRAQGSIGNCGIIAVIDAFEAKSGLYVGYTQYWMDVAIANGWASSNGGTYASQRDSLLIYMGTYYGVAISPYYGDTGNKTLAQLLALVYLGQKVILAVDLHYIPEFGSWAPSENANHAIMLVGAATINGVYYAAITNGWSIKSDTTTIDGYDPTNAYPITYVPFSELEAAYYAYNRVE